MSYQGHREGIKQKRQAKVRRLNYAVIYYCLYRSGIPFCFERGSYRGRQIG